VRQVCHRLLGAREETAEVQLDRFREHMRVRRVSIENGELVSVSVLCDIDREKHSLGDINFLCPDKYFER